MKQIKVLFLLILTNQLFAQTDSLSIKFQKAENSVNQKITALMKQTNTQGVSVGLVNADGMVWGKGYGYMDVAAKKPVDNKTVFCFGSITKVFTGIAIMQLHEKGKLDINKPIKDYIPEFQPLGSEGFINQITIASVLSHESGLPSDDYSLVFSNKPFSFDRVIQFFNNHYVCTKPYTIWAYSNIGYALLGAVVERVSGQAYTSYIQQNILEPLGMHHSSITLTEQTKPLLSKQYLKNKKEYLEPKICNPPAGELFSNIEDMSRFAQMILNKGTLHSVQILKESTFQEMVTNKNGDVRRDYDLRVGLTWALTTDGAWFKAGGSLYHDGGTRVFFSSLTILPFQKLAVISSSNSENASSIISQIDKVILEKAIELKGIDSTFPKQIISKKTIKPYFSPQKYNEIAGTYSVSGKTLKIKAKPKSLIVRVNPMAFVLKPLTDSTFSVKVRVLGIPVTMKKISKVWFDIVDGDTTIVITSWDRNFFLAKKITAVNQDLFRNWKLETGTYIRIDEENELFKTAELTIDENQLLFKTQFYSQKVKITLQPITDNSAIITGLGRSTGDRLTFNKENGKTILEFSGIKYMKKN